MDIVEIDGSYGEGGGAVLRNALSLSALLLKPVRVFNIRAGRSPPGLKRQHLTGLMALAEICHAEVRGARKGSTEIEFYPKRIGGGRFRFDVGTAGSLTLVLQSLMPAITVAGGRVELSLKGGTDVAWSPPVDYLRNVLSPLLKMMGYKMMIRLLRRGWYPKGGGILSCVFQPSTLSPLKLHRRGELKGIRGISASSLLPQHVVKRQANAAKKILLEGGYQADISYDVSEADCPGSSIVLWAEFGKTVIGASSLGKKGKRAEVVGKEAAEELLAYLKGKGTVDSHMADQILIYMIVAEGRSSFLTDILTEHARTNIWVIERFINDRFSIEKDGCYKVSIDSKGVMGYGTSTPTA